MLHYEFMRIAFITALLLGLSLPLIGSGAVYKRLSGSGDALAHSSLAGVAIGLVSGLHPLLVSIVTCVVAFLIIELLRKKFSKYAEIGVVVVLAAAIGLVGILSTCAKTSNFDSYLFGSIILLSNTELIAAIALTAVVVLFALLLYPQLFAAFYSSDEAKVAKIPVGILNFFHSLLLAVSVAIGAKIVGSLVVSSMIVLPTAIALLWKRSYRFTMVLSVVVSVAAMLGGLTISYYLDWPPGATIALLSVAILFLALGVRGAITLSCRLKKSKR